MSVQGRVLSAVTLMTACLALASCMVQTSPPPPSTPSKPFAPAPDLGVMPLKVRGAISGERRQILEFYFVNPDCSTGPTPILKLAKQPQHGKIEIVEGTAIAEFEKTSNFSACNAKKVPATLVFYTSEPGFIGDDDVAFDRIGVLGAYGYHSYTIKVR